MRDGSEEPTVNQTLDRDGAVTASISYFDQEGERPQTLVYPKTSGREIVRPKQSFYEMVIRDCRSLAEPPTLDGAGFELHHHVSAISDCYDKADVGARYYPEIVELLKEKTGALDVVVFDNNTRSAVRAAAGQHGVREPVEGAHVDYTPSSGPRRSREILEEAGKLEHASRRLALVNVWRPIVGPVEDHPLTVCDERSTDPDDFVEVEIHHFGEEDLDHPRHSGHVYSCRHNPNHRWYYASSMQPSEVLFLKGWDSAPGRACFTPHTGFKNPGRAEDFIPRESIEVRTLVVY